MAISILIPAYNRPAQLAQALDSLRRQDDSLIGEVIVADDSTDDHRPAIRSAIDACAVRAKVTYIPNEPRRGTYGNHWFLAESARCEHILFLHHDDWLCAGALELLWRAMQAEDDPRVEVWFGRNLIANEEGEIDGAMTEEAQRRYGKTGPASSRPMWSYCLTHAVPPDAFLMRRDTYRRFMRGERDGNIGDWAMQVRLANSGAWGRFIAGDISAYRVQPGTVTTSGGGMDVHLYYEMTRQLVVPSEALTRRRSFLREHAGVATRRYAREGERLAAWRCYLSRDWSWRERLSKRGLATLVMLGMPRRVWHWALRLVHPMRAKTLVN